MTARLVNADTGAILVERLELADTWWRRFRGLQFRAPLEAGEGLLLVPCNSVHTCFVRGPIDVVLLDLAGRVVAVRTRVSPWRVVFATKGAWATLELPGGHSMLRPGDGVKVVTDDRSNAIFSERR